MQFRDDAPLDTGDVQDRRGGGGAGRAIAVGGGGLGVVGVLVLLLVQLLAGGGGSGSGTSGATGLGPLFDGTGGDGQATSGDVAQSCRTGEDANSSEQCAVVAIIDSVQDYWRQTLGSRYTDADTVFFNGSTETGCGQADTGTGPFYCPADEQVYIDLSFFQQLRTRFGAEGGTFVDAYVLAHEYGHHVQDLLGVLNDASASQTGPTGQSVRRELQADCYAGVWAHHSTTTPDASGQPLVQDITQDDVDRALDTAGRIGDDYIEKNLEAQSPDPSSYTHGTSAERKRWFTTGYSSGDPARCDTFAAKDLG